MKIRWQDTLPDTEVLEKGDRTGMEQVIITAQLRWAGHVLMSEEKNSQSHIVLRTEGRSHSNRGCQKKRYKGRLKQNLKKCDTDKETWEDLARDRVMWRALINKSNLYFEANTTTKAKQKRDDRKERQLNPACQDSSNM